MDNMWPKVFAQLVELLPHISRLIPMADKFFASKTSSEKANEAAMLAMADGVRGDLGQVTASHAGLYRQLQQQGAKLDEAVASAHQSTRVAQSTADRVSTLEQKMEALVVWVKACALLLALMLILLGVLNLSGVLQKVVSRFTPQHASGHAAPLERRTVAPYGWYTCLRPLAIGLVHGLAGSAAIALLVLSTIHSTSWAILYLVIFGAGTMLGMMCMTIAMALPLVYAGSRMPQINRYLGVLSGVVSVSFGSFLVYQLGYVGGLFTRHPHWIPQ